MSSVSYAATLQQTGRFGHFWGDDEMRISTLKNAVESAQLFVELSDNPAANLPAMAQGILTLVPDESEGDWTLTDLMNTYRSSVGEMPDALGEAIAAELARRKAAEKQLADAVAAARSKTTEFRAEAQAPKRVTPTRKNAKGVVPDPYDMPALVRISGGDYSYKLKALSPRLLRAIHSADWDTEILPAIIEAERLDQASSAPTVE